MPSLSAELTLQITSTVDEQTESDPIMENDDTYNHIIRLGLSEEGELVINIFADPDFTFETSTLDGNYNDSEGATSVLLLIVLMTITVWLTSWCVVEARAWDRATASRDEST